MREFQAAVVAAAEAAWNASQIYEVGAVPTSPVTPYSVVGVSSGAMITRRLSTEAAGSGYRIAVQAVGKNASEVGFAVEKADSAFADTRLSVTGFDCSPCLVEVSSPIIRDPDGGGFLTCTLTYTFTAYPA